LPEEIRNPTQYYDPAGTWTNPHYITGPEDGYCALSPSDSDRLYVSGFGFNIPANAVIEEVYMGMLNITNVIGADAFPMMAMFFKGYTMGFSGYRCGVAVAAIICRCADCLWAESTNLAEIIGFTPDDINLENFDVYVYISQPVDYGRRALYDAVYLRVVYSVPVIKKRIGNGLAFVG